MGRTERLAQPLDFGKYQLIALLAKGRMADVYKAKSHGVEGFEKILCVKIIHPALSANPAFVESLIDEAKRSVALSHANIAQVLDLGHEEDLQRYYVAVEFISGFDLARALRLAKRFGAPLSQALSVFIISEVAKGLDYAHRRKDFDFNSLNILHRSLRPENIMLSFDGEVKITDFGISQAMETAPIIDDEDVIFRHLYMAPEVARGQAYTRQSDIYSLGLIMYELLAGFHPYRHEDAQEVRRRAIEGQIPPISDHIILPRQLQQSLEAMLVTDPAGRAQSAGQIYEELIGYIFGNALEADNLSLSMAIQELRRHEQNSSDTKPAPDVGIKELSQAEITGAFARAGLFPGSGAAPSSALPASRLGPRQHSAGPDQPLPGELETLYQSAKQGRGKAVLLSGHLGRGRLYLPDRLAEAVEKRTPQSSVLIQTSDDDRLRPFGALGDLLLGWMQRRIAEDNDPIAILKRWGASEEACHSLNALLSVDLSSSFHANLRKENLLELILVTLQALSQQSPFVVIIDRVERLDQVSLEILRDTVAKIGEMSVLFVMTTQTEDSIRAVFDAGQPRDLEAIRVSGDELLTPEELDDLSPQANSLLTLLSMADRALSLEDAAKLLEESHQEVAAAAELLLDRGAIRLPEPGRFRADVPNWLTRRRKQGVDDSFVAATVLRYLLHRTPHHEQGRLSPVFLRLQAAAGERRQLLALAHRYGDWLQRNGWQHTALHYFQYISDLLGAYGLGIPKTRVTFTLEAAEIALEMALIDRCRMLLEPLSALTEATRDEAGFVRSQLLLGHLAMQQDDLEEARGYFQRAVQTARSLEHSGLYAHATLALAGWYERFGDPAAARDRLESTLNLFTHLDTRQVDLRARALLLQRAARMWADRGMLNRAERPVQELASLANAVPYPSILCRAHISQARLSSRQGDLQAVTAAYESALALARRYGLRALEIEILREQAGTSLHFARYEEAIYWAEQVLGFAEIHGDYYSEQRARDLRALAQIHLGQDLQQAMDHLRISLRRATERGVPKDVYRGHDLMARALSAIGHEAEAEHHRRHALNLRHNMRMDWVA